MSDVHGQAGLFFRMLEKIDLRPQDALYILGDVVGKGPDALGILRFLMERARAASRTTAPITTALGPTVLIRGNHEEKLLEYMCCGQAAETLTQAETLESEKVVLSESVFGLYSAEALRAWAAIDGASVLRQLRDCSLVEQLAVLHFLSETPLALRTTFAGYDWLLLHGAPPIKAQGCLQADASVLENRYASLAEPSHAGDGVIAAVGHTPTFRYGSQYSGKIIRTADKVLLDCGAGWGYALGCLRAEDGATFYVPCVPQHLSDF